MCRGELGTWRSRRAAFGAFVRVCAGIGVDPLSPSAANVCSVVHHLVFAEHRSPDFASKVVSAVGLLLAPLVGRSLSEDVVVRAVVARCRQARTERRVLPARWVLGDALDALAARYPSPAARRDDAASPLSTPEGLFLLASLAILRVSDLARLDFVFSMFLIEGRPDDAGIPLSEARGALPARVRGVLLVVLEPKNAPAANDRRSTFVPRRRGSVLCAVRFLWSYVCRRALLRPPAEEVGRRRPVFVHERSFSSSPPRVLGFYSPRSIGVAIRDVLHALLPSAAGWGAHSVRSAAFSAVLSAEPELFESAQAHARWGSRGVALRHYAVVAGVRAGELVVPVIAGDAPAAPQSSGLHVSSLSARARSSRAASARPRAGSR